MSDIRELDFGQTVRETIKNGAVLLDGCFPADEVNALRRGVLGHDLVTRRSPTLGFLVDGLAQAMNGGDRPLFGDFNPIVGHAMEELVPMTHAQEAHVDCGRGRFGVSIIIPVEGEDVADFYTSEAPFTPVRDLQRRENPVQHFRYGLGDAAIIRQQLDVVEPENMEVISRYDQLWHVGITACPRVVRVCDIVMDAVPAHVI